jgi:hypothetical protein
MRSSNAVQMVFALSVTHILSADLTVFSLMEGEASEHMAIHK